MQLNSERLNLEEDFKRSEVFSIGCAQIAGLVRKL